MTRLMPLTCLLLAACCTAAGAQNQTVTFTPTAGVPTFAKREPVLRSTLSSLDLQWDWGILQSMVTSRVVPGTQLLEIAVLDTDPQLSLIHI